jgi:hypothetical protein
MTIAALVSAVFVGLWLAFSIAAAVAAVLLDCLDRNRGGRS